MTEHTLFDTNTKGAISESTVTTYFLRKGLHVFSNTSRSGPVDLITFNPDTGERQCWEVKTENYRLSGPKKGSRIGRRRRNTKFTDIINMVYVDLETHAVREGIRYDKSVR
tara:strand:+ start:59 stop:391 length:333 start_codon:yes stop_codon:yes gene_type:complete